MEWVTVMTAIVALYGAILSTYTVIESKSDKQRNIKIKLYNGFLTLGPELQLSDPMLLIEAINPGNRSVTLNTVGIRLPDKRTVAIPAPNSHQTFPYALEEGQNCVVWLPMHEFAKDLKNSGYKGILQLMGFYRNQIGEEYYSNRFPFDVDEWAH